jgi:hypothetical protein
VLVVTDKPGDEVLEQTSDPGGEIDDLWMARASRKLASGLNQASRSAQRFGEMPIYRMP